MRLHLALVAVAACAASVLSAPTPHAAGPNEGTHQHPAADAPVEELEKLKSTGEQHTPVPPGGEHVEYHSVDAVKSNGELVSRVEEHATADAAPGEQTRVHAHTQLDVPAQGVHKELVQDGGKIEVHDTGVPTAAPADEKVYHGAARLAGPGAPAGSHTPVRRAFTAEVKDNKNFDHGSLSGPSAGVQYSPLDMAEYVFWTGDERGVTTAIEEFLQEGLMTKEEAISFLQEIKYNMEYLKLHYAQSARADELQQERVRNLLADQAKDTSYQYRVPSLPSLSLNSDYSRTVPNRNWDFGNNIPQVPVAPFDFRQEPVKRSFDPMLQTNIISTSDYDRDGGAMVSEEEYEEMMDKLRAADTLYTEYTLEEVIYQLAKIMFRQSLTSAGSGGMPLGRGAGRAGAGAGLGGGAATGAGEVRGEGVRRFLALLELQAARGELPPAAMKTVLDVMIAALSDTVSEYPELMARETGGVTPGTRLMRQFLETAASEPGAARALLAARPHKYALADRN